MPLQEIIGGDFMIHPLQPHLFTNAHLTQATITDLHFLCCNFEGTQFINSNLSHSIFVLPKFSAQTSFSGTDVAGCIFIGANVTRNWLRERGAINYNLAITTEKEFQNYFYKLTHNPNLPAKLLETANSKTKLALDLLDYLNKCCLHLYNIYLWDFWGDNLTEGEQLSFAFMTEENMLTLQRICFTIIRNLPDDYKHNLMFMKPYFQFLAAFEKGVPTYRAPLIASTSNSAFFTDDRNKTGKLVAKFAERFRLSDCIYKAERQTVFIKFNNKDDLLQLRRVLEKTDIKCDFLCHEDNDIFRCAIPIKSYSKFKNSLYQHQLLLPENEFRITHYKA